MCFSKEVSLLTCFIGIFFIILLVNYGNKKFEIENKIFGNFFFFVIFIQFMEFIFWIDLDNKLGLNKIMTIIGSIINMMQPVLLYLIKVIFIKPDIFSLKNNNLIVLIINVFYTIYISNRYSDFLKNGKIITKKGKHNHLDWDWKNYYNDKFYPILVIINSFWLADFYYSLFFVFILSILFFISFTYYHYNYGELWCFFSISVPFLLYLYSFK